MFCRQKIIKKNTDDTSLAEMDCSQILRKSVQWFLRKAISFKIEKVLKTPVTYILRS